MEDLSYARLLHAVIQKRGILRTPVRADDKFATGTVFNDSKDSFVITQNIEGAEPVTALPNFCSPAMGVSSPHGQNANIPMERLIALVKRWL